MEKQKTIWAQYEDNALKQLRINRKMAKWSLISKILDEQFSIKGKSGKICRERFQNCLNQQFKKESWNAQQQIQLIKLHNQKGNKWAQISKKLQRSDNAVKNHFHSKLRKALRRINLKISLFFKSQLKQIKNNIISKIIQTAEQIYHHEDENSQKYKSGLDCYNLKNRILKQLQGTVDNLSPLQLKDLRDLVLNINSFSRNFKKKTKKQTRQNCQSQSSRQEFQKNSSHIKSLQKLNYKKQNQKEKLAFQRKDNPITIKFFILIILFLFQIQIQFKF